MMSAMAVLAMAIQYAVVANCFSKVPPMVNFSGFTAF
jgi:hypothetical protein